MTSLFRKNYILSAVLAATCTCACAAPGNGIVKVFSHGFVDLEGAKADAIIIQYESPVEASSISLDTYEVLDYAIWLEDKNGYDRAIERDGDSVQGNEGRPLRIYVNSKPEKAAEGKSKGCFVIIEVDTNYMLSGQNLPYTESMIASVRQVLPVKTSAGVVESWDEPIANFDETGRRPSADTSTILLPEFAEGSGWTLHYIGRNAFHAKHCYSEYTGKYEDFELPYAIYVPSKAEMEKNKGNISLVIHMEHAGGNDTDPMAGITSSRAAVKLASRKVQDENPAIVVVPQVEQSRRSTDDLVASSELNTAAWELLDSLLATYKGYINESRIYGTGQSMGGMALLNMSAQRDNFFAGLAIVGSQWSNNYNKDLQHNGSPERTPDNDPISFNGFGLDRDNFRNWYYMISDDNILIHTCLEDPMATGEWQYAADYLKAAGAEMAKIEMDPYSPLDEQNKADAALTNHDNTTPGSGLNWCVFTRGSHMSTWKYGYQLDAPFEWLFAQRRETAQARGKVEGLNRPWLGRDADGNILPGSGTKGLNSAQFTPNGISKYFVEGWTAEDAAKAPKEQPRMGGGPGGGQGGPGGPRGGQGGPGGPRGGQGGPGGERMH